MKRCSLYLRVSTTKQQTENQEHLLRQFAASQGWELIAVYSDEVSGGKSEKMRPGFRAMLDAASRHEFEVLLFFSLDRFSREGVLQTLQYLNRLSSYGVMWRSYSESYIDSCGLFADVVVSIMATLARQERLKIAERTKLGLERARREGKRLGRPPAQVPIDEISSLRGQGLSWRAITRTTGVPRSTAQEAFAEYSRRIGG